MINDRLLASRQPVFTSRRALVAGALALLANSVSDPEGEAKKRRRKRKPSRKKRCGPPGAAPIKGRCCTGAVLVDGACQACLVCPRGCRFTSVQQALDAATAGEAITICPGTYAENLTIAQSVRLAGGVDASGTPLTTLQGARPASVVQVRAGSVVLQHLRITGGQGDGAGIANLGATLRVIGCDVRGNVDPKVLGGGIFNAGALILDGSTISQNIAAEGGGIYNAGSFTDLQLINSQVRGNRAGNGGGIATHEGASVRLDAASEVTANIADREGGGIFASQTASRVDLASRDNVFGNTPSNCDGAPIDFCGPTGIMK